MDSFSEKVKLFLNDTLVKVNQDDPLEIRKVNDRLMQLERYFIEPRGLPDRPETGYYILILNEQNIY